MPGSKDPFMHRAKHRAAGRASADALATTPMQRFAADPGPAPTISSLPGLNLSAVRVRLQPVGATLSVTVLGAAAAVTAVVAPPTATETTAIETTGPLAPVQNTAPAPAPETLAAPELTVPAPALPAEQPTVQVADLIDGVTADMQKVTPTVEARVATVANTTALLSPAARRQAVVSNALSKLGKPYRWGASGPNAFDCSGLVKWSFGSAGRALPRSSRAMAGVGTPVSKANLQPGDLVFFYKPISHVGIYIGNGKMVHASNRKSPVKVSDISRMPFTKAVRV
jgi:peptidoglycan DL-endopeptidase CwlO